MEETTNTSLKNDGFSETTNTSMNTSSIPKEIQYTREPSYKKHIEEESPRKFKFVEVEHMSGIIPKKQKSYTGQRERLLGYNEDSMEIFEDTSLHDKFLYLDDNDIYYDFFKEQYDFLLSLSDLELEVLNFYSNTQT